jgi:DNA-binding MarR family transcriptional regulator
MDGCVNSLLRYCHIFSQAVQSVLQNNSASQASDGNLSYRQVSLLTLISSKGGHLVGDVVHFLGVSYAAASQMIDKLVKMDLLVLESDQRDRRVKRIRTTEKGEEIANQFRKVQRECIQQLISQYDQDDLKQVVDGLADMTTILVSSIGDDVNQVCLKCGIFDSKGCILNGEMNASCPYLSHWDEHSDSPGPSPHAHLT